MTKPTNGSQGPDHDGETLAVVERKTKTQRPPMYKVLLLNDDYTPMDFVVLVLKHIFNKTHDEAIKIMLMVHMQGASVCGVYTRDVAETKADEVMQFALAHDHPLQCTVEKE